MYIYTNAPEAPPIAPKAGNIPSSSRYTLPTLEKIASARANWASLTFALPHIAETAQPTLAAIFGITRMTGVPSGSREAYQSSVLPAAMVITSLPEPSLSEIPPRTPSNICGFTARTTTSHFSTKSAALSAGISPHSFASASVLPALLLKP